MGMEKNGKEKQNPLKLLVIGIVLAGMLAGFYVYVNQKMEGEQTVQETETVTRVQQVLHRNLEIQYPPSPREVVKYFCEITECFYNEEYTDEQFQELAFQIQGLYDEELIANQTQDSYLQNLISDVAAMKQNDVSISTYSLPSSTEVNFFQEDGFEWAKLYCNFSIRQGSGLKESAEQFLLRKDGNGRWKIYGWQLVQ